MAVCTLGFQFDRDFPAATQFFPKATKANQSFSSSKNLRGEMIIFPPRGVKHYEVAYYFNAIDAVPREKRIIPANPGVACDTLNWIVVSRFPHRMPSAIF